MRAVVWCASSTLQWSPGRSTGETRGRASLLRAPSSASMEPRSFNRGDLDTCSVRSALLMLQWSPGRSTGETVGTIRNPSAARSPLQWSPGRSTGETGGAVALRADAHRRFNGAPVVQPGSQVRGRVLAADESLLQWSPGRSTGETWSAVDVRGPFFPSLQWSPGRSTGETRVQMPRGRGARSASMEPRSFNRGDRLEGGRRAPPLQGASMEPRSFNRGDPSISRCCDSSRH